MQRGIRHNPAAVIRGGACAVLAIGFGAFASGCFFGGGRQPAVITSNDPGSKIPAIKKAADAKDTETARQLVKSLESEDPAVRFYAIRGLQSLTGETFGYVWFSGDDQVRLDAIDKWKHWLDANAGSLAGGNHDEGK